MQGRGGQGEISPLYQWSCMKKWHSVGWAFIRTQRRTLDIVLIFCQRSTCFYTLCILCNFATDYLCSRVCPCGSCALPLWKGRSCDSLAATADLPIGSQPPSPHQGCHWRDRSTWESPRGRERSLDLSWGLLRSPELVVKCCHRCQAFTRAEQAVSRVLGSPVMARPALPSCASPHLKSTGGSHFRIASRRLSSGQVAALRNRLDFLLLETLLILMLIVVAQSIASEWTIQQRTRKTITLAD